MALLISVLLIVIGILGAAPLLTSKMPQSGGAINKLTPFAGYLGIASILIALFYTIDMLRMLSVMGAAPVYALIAVASWAVLLGLGIVLGYGMIQEKALANKPDAAAKGERLHAKLLAYQVPMGIAAIVLGIIGLLHL